MPHFGGLKKQFVVALTCPQVPKDSGTAMATGYSPAGTPVGGRGHVYPEMAVAGLWTTVSDLARFAIGIQQSLTGQSNPVISPTMTHQMLTVQKAEYGLGVFISGTGRTLQFFHNGRDIGFDTTLKACAETGQGAVIMINANDGSHALLKIADAIAKEYHWPDAH